MNESLAAATAADLMDDLRRLSTLEREFLHRWRCELGMMSATPQLARLFDRLQRLAALEAKAQRDHDAAVLAVIEREEFADRSPQGPESCPELDAD